MGTDLTSSSSSTGRSAATPPGGRGRQGVTSPDTDPVRTG
ncbi:hypothetical protein YT1_3374 [Rhodococcus ruber]|nr:hypothetical protein YT1_3374 [Rhodococcus ruber]